MYCYDQIIESVCWTLVQINQTHEWIIQSSFVNRITRVIVKISFKIMICINEPDIAIYFMRQWNCVNLTILLFWSILVIFMASEDL